MPKIVDVAQRRSEIARAVWAVIRRDGLHSVSVRNVARETGLSPGALRHYFATQDELLSFAMELVADRVRTRIRSLGPLPDDPRAAAEALLAEVLPLDPERLAEAQVWAAFCARALVDETLSRLRDLTDDGLRGLCGQVVTGLAAAGPPGPGADLDLETERLHALVDGLTLHAVMRPAQATPELVIAVLRRHLDALTAPLPPATDTAP